MLRAPLLRSLLFTVLMMFWARSVMAQHFILCDPIGGKKALQSLIENELIYPPQALENGIHGEVWLIFNVMADGSVEDLRIWKGLEPTCDAEALRLASLVQWRPALLAGKPVDAEHSMVIEFNPKRYRKWLRHRRPLESPIMELPAAIDHEVHLAHKVERAPQPIIPGGMAGLHRWWRQEIRYPPEARRLDIQGVVKLRFIVEASGTISNAHTLNDLGGGCVRESLRMVNAIAWEPGTLHGERVRTLMEMDVIFKLP